MKKSKGSNLDKEKAEREVGYEKQEKVLCLHSGLLYEAKILDILRDYDPTEGEEGDEGPSFFVHYMGWSGRWDESVSHDRLYKYNDENLHLQKRLKLEYQERRKSKKKSIGRKSEKRLSESSSVPLTSVAPTPPEGDTASVGANRKSRQGSTSSSRTRVSESSEAGALESKPLEQKEKVLVDLTPSGSKGLKFDIPIDLKTILVDDWERVFMQKRVYEIPFDLNVEKVLKEYLESFSSERSKREFMEAKEFCEGLKDLMNKFLLDQLLYDIERQHYKKLSQNDQLLTPDENRDLNPTEVFGTVHILRLLVKFFDLMPASSFDEQAIALIRDCGNELIRYLTKHEAKYLSVFAVP